MHWINTDQLQKAFHKGTNIIDVRSHEELSRGYLKQSLAVDPQNGKLAEWIGQLLYYPVNETVLVTSDKSIDITTLQEKMGLPEDVALFYWSADTAIPDSIPLDMVIPVDGDEFALDYKHDKNIEVLDLRPAAAYAAAHLSKAVHVEWLFVGSLIQEYELEDKIYLLTEDDATAWAVATLFRFNGFQFARPVLARIEDLPQYGLTLDKPKKKKS